MPLPHGDQVKNAEYFKELGLCKVLREKELCDVKLTDGIYDLMNDRKLKKTLDASGVKCGNDKIIKEIRLTLR